MIKLEDGLELSGRCVWGYAVGWVHSVDRDTYQIRWLDGSITTQYRPDFVEVEEE